EAGAAGGVVRLHRGGAVVLAAERLQRRRLKRLRSDREPVDARSAEVTEAFGVGGARVCLEGDFGAAGDVEGVDDSRDERGLPQRGRAAAEVDRLRGALLGAQLELAEDCVGVA